MNIFDQIPNKRPLGERQNVELLWPELGNSFELNEFYERYSSAEGWLGESYLAFWTPEEIFSYRQQNAEAFSDKYRFFASDGGGAQFGFFIEDGSVVYVAAPDIGSEDDIKILGDWHGFIMSIKNNSYI